jgi:hypothetical protein
MFHPRHVPRLLALLLVPLLVVVGTGRAQAFYLCGGGSVVRTACCCPAANPTEAPVDPRLESAACCSIEERGAAPPAARSPERSDAGHSPAPVVVLVALVATPAVAPSVIVVDRRSQAPPRTASRPSQRVALLL